MATEDVRPETEPEFTDVDTEDESEVVAHSDDESEDLPWCVGYFC